MDIATSEGRCHCPYITETPTVAAQTTPMTPAKARTARGTVSSRITAQAAASIVCPEGAELAAGDSVLMMNGRGNRPLIRVTAKQTTANTAICPANHQRRRISAVIMPIAAIVQLTAITSQDCATAFIMPVVQDGTSLCRFFQTSSSYDCPFSVNTHPHHTPKPTAIRSRPNTTHSTRLEIRGRTVSGSSRAKPRSISDAPSASFMSSGLKSRKEPDVDADASEPETGPSAANGSTTFDDESGCAAPEPTRLTAACGSRILGVCASFIRSTVRPRPGQGTTLVPAHSQIRT